MTLGSLFAGIGGFELAATWAGIKPIWSNEIDQFCCKVLRKNFKHEIIKKDIRECGRHNLQRVDIISGGFPCQDISIAKGKAQGLSGEKSGLWWEYWRIISEIKPKVVIVENSSEILNRGFGELLASLSEIGYDAIWDVIPAYWAGLPHQRKRIWLIAYPTGNGWGNDLSQEISNNFKRSEKTEPDISSFILGCQAESEYEGNPELIRIGNGIPDWVDRLKGLGNAIVPQVAYELFKAITILK